MVQEITSRSANKQNPRLNQNISRSLQLRAPEKPMVSGFLESHYWYTLAVDFLFRSLFDSGRVSPDQLSEIVFENQREYCRQSLQRK